MGLLLFIPFAAFAESDNVYLFADIGGINSGDLCANGGTSYTQISCSQISYTYGLGMGYIASNRFGFELTLRDLGEFISEQDSPVGGFTVRSSSKISGRAALLPATYTFFFNQYNAATLKLGLAYIRSESRTDYSNATATVTSFGSNYSALYGIAYTIKIGELTSWHLQYEGINRMVTDAASSSGIKNLGLLSLGMVAGF